MLVDSNVSGVLRATTTHNGSEGENVFKAVKHAQVYFLSLSGNRATSPSHRWTISDMWIKFQNKRTNSDHKSSTLVSLAGSSNKSSISQKNLKLTGCHGRKNNNNGDGKTAIIYDIAHLFYKNTELLNSKSASQAKWSVVYTLTSHYTWLLPRLLGYVLVTIAAMVKSNGGFWYVPGNKWCCMSWSLCLFTNRSTPTDLIGWLSDSSVTVYALADKTRCEHYFCASKTLQKNCKLSGLNLEMISMHWSIH